MGAAAGADWAAPRLDRRDRRQLDLQRAKRAWEVAKAKDKKDTEKLYTEYMALQGEYNAINDEVFQE